MDHYQETSATWNKVAGLYEEKFMALDLYNESYDYLCEALSEQQTAVLEVGCGPGMISRYLLNKRPDLIVLGTDVAENMVALAAKNNPEAHFEVRDCREITALNRSFDVILSGFCIPYLTPEDTKQFISDCSQLLHPGGWVYLSFVPGKPEQSGFQIGSSGDRVYFHFYEEEQLIEQLSSVGLDLATRFVVNYARNSESTEVHVVLIAKKRTA